MVFYSFNDLKVNQVKRMLSTKDSVLGHWKRLCAYSIKDAQQLLSGNVSTNQLRALGHPFARAGKNRSRGVTKVGGAKARKVLGAARVDANQLLGLPIIPKLPINKQSGRLLRSLNAKVTKVGDNYTLPIRFGAGAGKHALVVRPGGTKRMVDRKFNEEMRRRLRARTAGFERVVKQQGWKK